MVEPHNGGAGLLPHSLLSSLLIFSVSFSSFPFLFFLLSHSLTFQALTLSPSQGIESFSLCFRFRQSLDAPRFLSPFPSSLAANHNSGLSLRKVSSSLFTLFFSISLRHQTPLISALQTFCSPPSSPKSLSLYINPQT